MNVDLHPEIRPPRTKADPLTWLKENLFSTWYNVLLTIFSLTFIFILLRVIITWAIRDARWKVVTMNLKVFMIGRYPSGEAWRVLASLGIVVFLAMLTWVFRKKKDSALGVS